MEVKINNLINNAIITIYINSKDTVMDIKKLIASSFPPQNKISALNLRLSYFDPNTKQINYMFSPYRTILSYNGIMNSREIFVEKIGIQLDSAIAIVLENILPVLTFYYLYKNDFYYTKLFIHKIIFLLTCFYFICRLFICLKCYNNGKYFLSKLIINLIIYWFLYSIICGNSIFNDDFNDMTIYSYLFTIVFVFCDLLCIKLVKEHKDNENKNILFKYVKYPYYFMDCIVWLSMMIIVYNKRIIFFTIIKILYNIYLAFEEYIEDKGLSKNSSNIYDENINLYNGNNTLFNRNNNDNFYYNNNNNLQTNRQYNKRTSKVVIPFIL